MQLQYFDAQLIALVFIAIKLESNGNIHNLDMWQRPRSIAWRDIKKSLEGNPLGMLSYEPLWCHDLCYLCMSDTYLADMTWIKCCHMRGFMSSTILLAPGQTTHTYFTPTSSFLPPFFSGIYKHTDDLVTESKVRNAMFYNKDRRCDRSIMRACVCSTFWVAGQRERSLGLDERKRKRNGVLIKGTFSGR